MSIEVRLITEKMDVTRWDCGDPKHRHWKESAAIRCAKNQAWVPSVSEPRLLKADVLAARREGASTRELCERFGKSVGWVRRAIIQAERREREDRDAGLAGLPAMQRNALARAGLSTADAVRDAANDGRLQKVKGLGNKGRQWVLAWLAQRPVRGEPA